MTYSKGGLKMEEISEGEESRVWCDLEKPKFSKGFTSCVLMDFKRKADSSWEFHPMEFSKHGHQEDSIRNGIQHMRQEGENEHSGSGELEDTGTIRKCSYLPEEANSFEDIFLHPKSVDVSSSPFMIDDYSSSLSVSAESTNTSTECDSSASDSEDLESEEVSQASGDVKRNRLKLKQRLKTHHFNRTPSVQPFGETDVMSTNGSHDIIDEPNFCADIKDWSSDSVDNQTGKLLNLEDKELSQSVSVGHHWEDENSYFTPLCTGQETKLIDVHLTVNASYEPQNVPFVCLTSKSDGRPIIGHPVEIEVLRDDSETFVKKSIARKLFDDQGGRFHQTVGRTSKRKRTPVCYITNSLSSVAKNSVAGQMSENGLLMKQQSHEKFQKNVGQFKLGRALRATCVPVGHIFNKILDAVGRVQS